MQVSRDLDRFHGDHDDLRRWVFRIAHNRMTDAFRRRSRRPRSRTGRRPRWWPRLTPSRWTTS